jgi:hypothetical protein
MQIIRIENPEDQTIVARNKFIINHINIIAMRESKIDDYILLLFETIQDFNDINIYFQCMIKFDPVELDIIKRNHLFIGGSNFDNNENFNRVLQEMSSNNYQNLYTTDFYAKDSKDFPMYYYGNANKYIDKTHISLLDIYLNRECFIRLSLFFIGLSILPAPDLNFRTKDFNNIKYESIEHIKYDASVKVITENGFHMIKSHYTMNCGKTTYKINFWSNIDKDKYDAKLANPLDLKLYNAFYDNDYNSYEYHDVIITDDYILLLYYNNKFVRVNRALLIPRELAEKTNLIDRNKNIYEEEKGDNENAESDD